MIDELAVAMKARDFIAKCGPLALPVSLRVSATGDRKRRVA